MFGQIKDEMTRKICELKIWLNNVDEKSEFASISKGLCYVYMYGIYEETVRSVVQATIEALNAKKVKNKLKTFSSFLKKLSIF